MKTFGQFFEDIDQRREELRQKRLDQMKAQKDKVAEYQAQQRERVAANIEAQKQKTAQRMEKQKQDAEQRNERRKQAITSALSSRSERKPRRKLKKRVRTPQVRRPVTGDTSSTGTQDTQRP